MTVSAHTHPFAKQQAAIIPDGSTLTLTHAPQSTGAASCESKNLQESRSHNLS